MLVEFVVGSLLCSKTDGDFSRYIQTLFYEHPLNWDTPLIRTLSKAPSLAVLISKKERHSARYLLVI